MSFQLYAQKGTRLNKLTALEVTPVWHYTTPTDEAKLSAGHPSDSELTFHQASIRQILDKHIV